MTLSPRARKAIKILAISYALKTLLVGLAWIFVPELTERAFATLTAAFATAAAPSE